MYLAISVTTKYTKESQSALLDFYMIQLNMINSGWIDSVTSKIADKLIKL